MIEILCDDSTGCKEAGNNDDYNRCRQRQTFKETRSITINIFFYKKNLFKSFVKIGLSYVFTINMFSTAENCMEK